MVSETDGVFFELFWTLQLSIIFISYYFGTKHTNICAYFCQKMIQFIAKHMYCFQSKRIESEEIFLKNDQLIIQTSCLVIFRIPYSLF